MTCLSAACFVAGASSGVVFWPLDWICLNTLLTERTRRNCKEMVHQQQITSVCLVSQGNFIKHLCMNQRRIALIRYSKLHPCPQLVPVEAIPAWVCREATFEDHYLACGC